MTVNKITLSNFEIEELPYFEENDPNVNPYHDFYSDVDLLRMVHKMSHIVLEKPTKVSYEERVPSDWHICHQFAFFYNHGLLVNDKSFLTRLPKEAKEELVGKIDKNADNYKKEIVERITNSKGKICRKYLKPEQDKLFASYKERFLTPQIIASLRAFNLDIEQFWYMFLFTVDYIYRKTHHVTDYYPTALNSFDGLYSITSEIPEYNPWDCSNVDASITVKYGKRKLQIDNPDTIKLLGSILHQFCEKHRNERDEDYNWCSEEWMGLNQRRERNRMKIEQMFGLEGFDSWKSIKNQTRVYYFREYMKSFFKDIKGSRHHAINEFIEDAGKEASCLASVDVELLIARLAWAANYLTLKEMPDDKDYLKSALKKFKPDKDLAHGDYHWLIGAS